MGILKNLLSFLTLILLTFVPAHPQIDVSYSKPEELEVKILEKLFQDILGKERVRVFVIGDKKEHYRRGIEDYSDNLHLVTNCGGADIVLLAGQISSIPEDCLKKPLFSTRRENISKFRGCLGAFYWKKGRPNIVLIKERLEERGIKMPKEYRRYIESEGRATELRRGFRI